MRPGYLRDIGRDSVEILLIDSPYIIDLESTNGTFVNDIEIPKASYYQLKHTDGMSIPSVGRVASRVSGRCCGFLFSGR